MREFWKGRAWWEVVLFLILALAGVVVVVLLFEQVSAPLAITGALLLYSVFLVVFLALFLLHIFGIYPEPPPLLNLIYGDRGTISLSKFQLLFWTFILSGILLYHIGFTEGLPAGNEVLYIGLALLFSGLIYFGGKYLRHRFPT